MRNLKDRLLHPQSTTARAWVIGVVAFVALASLFAVAQRTDRLDRREEQVDEREQAVEVIEREIERNTHTTSTSVVQGPIVVALPPSPPPTGGRPPATVFPPTPPTSRPVTVPSTPVTPTTVLPSPVPTLPPTPNTTTPGLVCRALPPACDLIAAERPAEQDTPLLPVILVAFVVCLASVWLIRRSSR